MRTAILLSLLLHTTAAFHQLHYLVVIPADLRYTSTQVACLHITCYEAKLQVNLVLECSAGHKLLVQETIQKEKTFMCTKFWVAPPADGTEEIATVKLIITGEGVSIEENKKVLIRKASSGTFIQTDKTIYQPGQTVKFRIVTLDEEFMALNDSDPKNNQIEQWLNVLPQGGIADLSFQLSDEPLLGTYIINVTSAKACGSFSVEDYVLPKFEVTFEAPNQIYALDKTFPLRVCGRYTYGKRIQGIVHVSLCQKIAPFLPSASKPDLCQEFSNQTDEMGCFFTNVTLSSFTRDFRYYQDSIVAEASLVENGTDIYVNASHKLLISKIGGTALFADVKSYYHTGEMYRGKIKVIDYQGKALKHKKVLLLVSCSEQQFKQEYITGDSGTASFSLNTTAWNSTLASLEAIVLHQDLDIEPGTADLSYQRASHFIRPFYSTSRSFVSIVRVPETMPCGKKQAVQVDFRIYQEDLEHGPKRVIFSYFVTGKRGIVHAGQKTVWVGLPRMLKGLFSIPLTFSLISAPAPRLVIYVIFPNGKIIADSAILSVSMCFRNKVELSFSTPETLPDSQVGLHMLAAPGSTCAVWAVDQSALLLKPRKELSSSLIYGLFPSVYNSRYPRQVSEDDNSCGFPNSDEPDVFTTFRIQVTLEEFDHFQLKPCKGCVYSSCLCAKEAKTFQWSITAEQLGYQIQLQYQHPDGSYSEFGTKDEYGNTCLTVSLRQATEHLQEAVDKVIEWGRKNLLLLRKKPQLSLEDAIAGRGEGESTVVRKALDCIASSLPEAASTYTQALLAYTFALAKDSQRTQELLDILDRKAIRTGGQIHWSQTSSKPRPSTSIWSQPLSLDVELTAYVLLALLSKPNTTGSDLTTASGIVSWLTRQQNAYGGFASTQDTVVALQALAKYAALTYDTEGVAEVRVRSQRGFGRKFQVSYQNRLLVQEAALTEVPGKFLVQAHGSCCVFTRMVLRYNMPSPQVSTSFALQVKTKPVNCTEDDTHSVTVYVNVRYTGKRATSGMVIVEVSLLSGFVLAPGSQMSLQHWHPVRRTENTQGGVAIYLDKLSHESETYVLHLEREIGVTNLKPGHVRVYDYYHPALQRNPPLWGSPIRMWTPFLLSCLLYTVGIVTQPRYLIIIPAALPYPSSQRVCLDLRGVEKPIRVALTLVHPSGNLSLYRKVVRNNWIFECSKFQVPQPAGSQEVGTVHLRISNGQYFSANEEKKVLIRRAGTGTFIQTDKPIYNPGQIVKFRIVTLTEEFTPVNSKYSMVEVQVGVPDSPGVMRKVLQKFDVFFEGPAQIYASDKTFPLRVCGRYSYEKAVQGTMRVTLCQKARRRPQNVSRDICREYSGLTTSKGCFTPSVITSVFNLAPSEEDGKLYAEASLLEMGTGIQRLSREGARVKLQDHYGNGMKNRKVYLIIKFMRRRFIKTYITDDSGIASFNLDTTAWNSSSVSLEGRFTLEGVMHTPRKPDFSYTNAYHHLQPFHVTTKSFLDIHPPTETLPCGLKWNIQVTFTLSRDDLGEDTSRVGFAYYVTGKAGIVVRGQRTVQVGKLNMLKGSFSIPLTFTADFTPSPSLVVYAIFPNGGVTADSIRFNVALCFENQVKVGLSAKEVQPGSAVQLQFQAAPGSLCAVQAVNEKMFFVRPESELTSQMVYGLFPAAYQHGYPAQVEEHSDHCVQPQSTSPLLREKPQHSFQHDIFNLFRGGLLQKTKELLRNNPNFLPMEDTITVSLKLGSGICSLLGYQVQLLYRHRDGSYSVFGQKSGEGNTWLTAFVVKSFGQARKYIYIDDKNIQDALRWLEQNQLPSGCFATKGSIFHSSLKGGVDDEISLGAYVAAALLELGQPLKSKLMQTTLRCLQQVVHNITNIYTEAVLAYVFALAGDYETTQELLYKLEEQAIKSGGQIHWSPKPSSPASTDFWPGTQSVDIELTAYVLLAYLSKPQAHAGDMTTAAGIVAWLTQQQNAYGGFASTQDTVVALQALAKYAARMFSTSGQALVRVKSQRTFVRAFQVTRQKRLLLQQAALTEIPGQFLVQVHGSSCVFAQIVLRYHEPPLQAAVTFTLRVNTELTNCSQTDTRFLNIRILASYIGNRVTSNMVIVEVSLLSGFVQTPGSKMLLERRTIVKKIEVKADVVYIYLEKLDDEPQTFILQLEQVIQVKNLKPASIKIYDYYQPDREAAGGHCWTIETVTASLKIRVMKEGLGINHVE
ncbi:alpha-2-macroglobulin-like protein 1 [Columba guinea]|nr:alpha-2-macroglobulin-like protein 1 [Columba guinea]